LSFLPALSRRRVSLRLIAPLRVDSEIRPGWPSSVHRPRNRHERISLGHLSTNPSRRRCAGTRTNGPSLLNFGIQIIRGAESSPSAHLSKPERQPHSAGSRHSLFGTAVWGSCQVIKRAKKAPAIEGEASIADYALACRLGRANRDESLIGVVLSERSRVAGRLFQKPVRHNFHGHLDRVSLSCRSGPSPAASVSQLICLHAPVNPMLAILFEWSRLSSESSNCAPLEVERNLGRLVALQEICARHRR